MGDEHHSRLDGIRAHLDDLRSVIATHDGTVEKRDINLGRFFTLKSTRCKSFGNSKPSADVAQGQD